jgi:hypothetical protein
VRPRLPLLMLMLAVMMSLCTACMWLVLAQQRTPREDHELVDHQLRARAAHVQSAAPPLLQLYGALTHAGE